MATSATIHLHGRHAARILAVAMAGAFGIAVGTANAQGVQSIGKGEGQVDIVAWPGYIERGETDKS